MPIKNETVYNRSLMWRFIVFNACKTKKLRMILALIAGVLALGFSVFGILQNGVSSVYSVFAVAILALFAALNFRWFVAPYLQYRRVTGGKDITLSYENLFFKNCSNLEFTGVLSCESRGDALRLEGCKNITFQSYMATSGAMAAFADGGGNENVVFRSFISSYTKEVAKLTGSGVTIQNTIVENKAVYPVYDGQ